METRTMFYLVLVALFGFAGNSFAMEEPPEINTPEEYAETIGRQRNGKSHAREGGAEISWKYK